MESVKVLPIDSNCSPKFSFGVGVGTVVVQIEKRCGRVCDLKSLISGGVVAGAGEKLIWFGFIAVEVTDLVWCG